VPRGVDTPRGQFANWVAFRVKLKDFVKFDSAASALEEITGLAEGKVTPKLASLLNEFKDEKKITLAVAESKLGSSIVKGLPHLNIKPVSDSATTEVFRAIRQHIADLVGMPPENFKEMSLGLSHSLSRHKLKFSPDKVDVMIVHAISMLDTIDKDLNVFAMRVKEWYGWHFPELAKILPDNLSYARVAVTMGMRTNAREADLSEILPHEIETAVKAAADISMGSDISEEDLANIKELAERVISLSQFRKDLSEYIDNRMKALAPNMTELLGPLVGARLIAHTGSIMGLAKSAGSTIQLLGAEKALFRALKTKHSTPKYGLIYHASLVGQASAPNKGKIARQLAAKVALAVRTDALADFPEDADDETRAAVGILGRSKIENSLRILEGKPINKGVAVNPNGIALGPSKWDVKEARKYNADVDGLAASAPKRPLIEEVDEEMADLQVSEDKKDKKSKKDKKDKEEKKAKDKVNEQDYERLAEQAGMSYSKFIKKLEKGQIRINPDGTVEKLKKDKEDKDKEGKKRKHEDTPSKEEKPKKKKKKSGEE
jgi:nucleolar protein 58